MMCELFGLESVAGTGRLQRCEMHNIIPVKDFTKQA